MAMDASEISKTTAIVACTSMTLLYVAILYTPTFLLRLPPPDSIQTFMIRRFICAAVSSVASLLLCAYILPVRKWEASSLLGVYGIRLDHIWQAVIIPLSLTSLMYAGSLVLKSLLLLDSWRDQWNHGDQLSRDSVKDIAPLTEELVFRACMIPLLLCGGLTTYTAVFLCPIFFSLAHLNHLLDTLHHRSLLQASIVVGFQLGYTVIFGWYASFLFVRTGHLTAPIIAHMFCNFMGLPVIYSQRTGLITVASIAGLLGFVWLLFPFTYPYLYNYEIDSCECWHRYCTWQ
ncbi:CAAX prenyl protease 2 isoform X2 [Daucus carota subsp. sativus]|uniref:CAAX prenyl protease 2 isoform X2 n=1 Tax=Daucus carota subsp. sativus TaxID=79200 RepID=UPI0030839A5F